jgi:hypothetical protein
MKGTSRRARECEARHAPTGWSSLTVFPAFSPHHKEKKVVHRQESVAVVALILLAISAGPYSVAAVAEDVALTVRV